MEIKLYNTLTRKKEIFKPISDKNVGIYTCGPTVYWYQHIGNLRTYIFEDTLKRTLIYNGYKVKHVMNITDVEDKIIGKMQAEEKTLKEITKPFIETFLNDLKKLNIEKADYYPRATETIKEIVKLIETLLENGFAYKGDDGSIYFKVSKFKNYGKLSNLKRRKIKNGARVSSDEYGKEEAVDFALWKKVMPDEPSWPAPFGEGRPGWHIECSAMSMKYLGESFDIHCGAIDLIFPHHENEIAQSEAATGKNFVNFWIEGEHLLVDGKKMSKSLGNFYTLDDIEKRGFTPLAFRYLMLNARYSSKLNFTWRSLEDSQSALKHIYRKVQECKNDPIGYKEIEVDNKKIDEYKNNFREAINDDLDMPRALSIFFCVFDDIHLKNHQKLDILLDFDKIFGLDLNKIKVIEIPEEIKILLEQRKKARTEKDWQTSDSLRKKIEELGWLIEDTAAGPVLRKK